EVASMGVAIDGSTRWWPGETSAPPILPAFSPFQRQSGQYIDVFNRGTIPFDYTVSLPEEFRGLVSVNPDAGKISKVVCHSAAVGAGGITWLKIPDLGRTGAGMTVLPRNAALQTPGRTTPHLEYPMYLMDPSDHQVEVWTYLSPRNSVRIATGDQDGLLYAI